MLKRVIIAALVVLVLGIGVIWLLGDDEDDYEEHGGTNSTDWEEEDNWQEEDDWEEDDQGGSITVSAQASTASASRGYTMSVDDRGELNITRLAQPDGTPMGQADSWTIFVYLCGSDLESDGGMATMDLEEMVKGSSGSDYRFVIQTGGSSSWENSSIKAKSMQRFVVENGKMSLVDEGRQQNMGSYDTLKSFLSWGVGTYPAEHMGVIFWDHGGGSISGVCVDENAGDDCLTLREIDAAFAEVLPQMTDRFEFIGFDACLMATAETANVCATYADCLYASEETEPGYGWDYAAMGNFLKGHRDAGGADLGKVVADSFYESCKQDGEEDESTLSVIDLTGMDEMIRAFHRYAQNLYTRTEDQEVLVNTARAICNVTNFGGNNRASGYTNMVDFGGLVQAGNASGAPEVVSLLNSAVIYMKNGSDYADATGLSIYYPLQIQGSDELTVLSEIALSPYYLSFVDRAAQCGVKGEEDYDFSDLFDLWDSLFSDWDSDEDYAQWEQDNQDYWDYCDDFQPSGTSKLISFAKAPGLDANGVFGFTLTKEALKNTLAVEGGVYYVEEDAYIDLGTTADVDADWDRGIFSDRFDGYWYSLPDGQNLCVYVETEGDDFAIYSSPVQVNGRETNLIFRHDLNSDDVTILGLRDGVDDAGMADRITGSLKKGDTIVPLYYAASMEDDEEFMYEGDSWRYDGSGELTFELLEDGEYLYGFTIYDLYWDYLDTAMANFTVDGEDVYYSGMED